jgi:hypothetical protein
MTENIIIQVGKCKENEWRRNNLLSVHHCEDKGSFHEVSFQYVEHTFNGVKQVRLIYQIVK